MIRSIILSSLVLLGVFTQNHANPTKSLLHKSCKEVASAKKLLNPVKALELNWHCLEQTVKKNHLMMHANSATDYKQDPEALYKTVKQVVLPMISVDHMAGLTLGPKWREATKTQRAEFIENFGYMLVRSYSAALLRVSDYEIKFRPLRDDAWKKSEYIQVNGRLVSKSNNKGSSITYYLRRSGNTWKIYDVSIEGVSFVKNFAAQFREYPNMKKLLDRLITVNKRKQ